MARPKKQKIEINDNSSLQNIMQEVYNDACAQIKDTQKVINEITVASNPEDVDEFTKIAKAKTDALKVRDSAIKIKLDVGKLQNEIIKHNGDTTVAINNIESNGVGKDSFAAVREMINKSKVNKE